MRYLLNLFWYATHIRPKRDHPIGTLNLSDIDSDLFWLTAQAALAIKYCVLWATQNCGVADESGNRLPLIDLNRVGVSVSLSFRVEDHTPHGCHLISSPRLSEKSDVSEEGGVRVELSCNV